MRRYKELTCASDCSFECALCCGGRSYAFSHSHSRSKAIDKPRTSFRIHFARSPYVTVRELTTLVHTIGGSTGTGMVNDPSSPDGCPYTRSHQATSAISSRIRSQVLVQYSEALSPSPYAMLEYEPGRNPFPEHHVGCGSRWGTRCA